MKINMPLTNKEIILKKRNDPGYDYAKRINRSGFGAFLQD